MSPNSPPSPVTPRPEATAANDRGAVPDDFRMDGLLLQLKRSPVLESEFEAIYR